MRNYLLSTLGYVVISIDSRGSSNRGKAFESHIYKRLGQVELKDQLEVLSLLASDMAFLDLTRVAINGWSYGGYLALRGVVDHPDFFKVLLLGVNTFVTYLWNEIVNSSRKHPVLFYLVFTKDVILKLRGHGGEGGLKSPERKESRSEARKPNNFDRNSKKNSLASRYLNSSSRRRRPLEKPRENFNLVKFSWISALWTQSFSFGGALNKSKVLHTIAECRYAF